MRAQSVKEMLAIALPFTLAIIGFVILMGGFFEITVKVGEAFIPHKVASMVLHTLTGSVECLALKNSTNDLPHKGLLDLGKIETAESESATKEASAYIPTQYGRVSIPGVSAQLSCAHIPCWRWRAIVNIIKPGGTTETRKFGDDSGRDDIWTGLTSDEVVINVTTPSGIGAAAGAGGGAISGLTTLTGLGYEIHFAPALTSRKMPVVIEDPNSGERYFGSIEVEVATKHASTCQKEIDLMIISSLWAKGAEGK